MQRRHTSRGRERRRRSAPGFAHGLERGFSLIEMMVVLSIVMILGSVAFVGIRKDQFAGAYRRMVEDARGVVVQARNLAIEEQAQVLLRVTQTGIAVSQISPTTKAEVAIPVMGLNLDRIAGGLLTRATASGDPTVCILGFTAGVSSPSARASAVSPPASCAAREQVMVIEPDGSFTAGANTPNVVNAGFTLWVADQRVSGQTTYGIVQMFSGGLIRASSTVSL